MRLLTLLFGYILDEGHDVVEDGLVRIQSLEHLIIATVLADEFRLP